MAGGKREGAGRKPGIPNKASNGAKELAQQWGPAAIKKAAAMAGLVLDKDGKPKGMAESEAVQKAALDTILDRAYGKPSQALVGGGDDDPPINVVQKIILSGPAG